MSYDHFRPPEHFSRTAGLLFRAGCWVAYLLVMWAFVHYCFPLIDPFATAFADWVTYSLLGFTPPAT